MEFGNRKVPFEYLQQVGILWKAEFKTVQNKLLSVNQISGVDIQSTTKDLRREQLWQPLTWEISLRMRKLCCLTESVRKHPCSFGNRNTSRETGKVVFKATTQVVFR